MATGSNKKPKLSAACIDDLSDDLLSNIFNRNSTKSTFLCKSVCKRWFHLISHSQFIIGFIAGQRQKHHQEQELLVDSYGNNKILNPKVDDPGLQVSLSFLPCFEQKPKNEDLYVVGSCNGLVLCFQHPVTISPYKYSSFIICNPLTKQWATLPPPPHAPCHVGFICDPYYDIDKQGQVNINSDFGFKVVTIPKYFFQHGNPPMYTQPTREFHIEIFSSETSNWTRSIVLAPEMVELVYYKCFSAVLYNKRMHWLTQNNKILVFDPYANKVDCLTGPSEAVTSSMSSVHLCVRHGSLCFVQYTIGFVIMWQLKDYAKQEWSINRNVDFSRRLPYSIIDCLNGGDIIAIDSHDPDIVDVNDRVAISFNLRTKTWRKIVKQPFRRYCVHNVISILVPLWPIPIPPLPSHISPYHSKPYRGLSI